MPTFHQRFTGPVEEDFPRPPIARRLQPGDVVEYEAPLPIVHARLELVDEHGERIPDAFEVEQTEYEADPEGFAAKVEAKPTRNRKAAVDEPASAEKE